MSPPSVQNKKVHPVGTFLLVSPNTFSSAGNNRKWFSFSLRDLLPISWKKTKKTSTKVQPVIISKHDHRTYPPMKFVVASSNKKDFSSTIQGRFSPLKTSDELKKAFRNQITVAIFVLVLSLVQLQLALYYHLWRDEEFVIRAGWMTKTERMSVQTGVNLIRVVLSLVTYRSTRDLIQYYQEKNAIFRRQHTLMPSLSFWNTNRLRICIELVLFIIHPFPGIDSVLMNSLKILIGVTFCSSIRQIVIIFRLIQVTFRHVHPCVKLADLGETATKLKLIHRPFRTLGLFTCFWMGSIFGLFVLMEYVKMEVPRTISSSSAIHFTYPYKAYLEIMQDAITTNGNTYRQYNMASTDKILFVLTSVLAFLTKFAFAVALTQKLQLSIAEIQVVQFLEKAFALHRRKEISCELIGYATRYHFVYKKFASWKPSASKAIKDKIYYRQVTSRRPLDERIFQMAKSSKKIRHLASPEAQDLPDVQKKHYSMILYTYQLRQVIQKFKNATHNEQKEKKYQSPTIAVPPLNLPLLSTSSSSSAAASTTSSTAEASASWLIQWTHQMDSHVLCLQHTVYHLETQVTNFSTSIC